MYRKKLSILNMQRIRSATGLYSHWDDHEFINDFSIPENGRPLYDRGVQAFRDYMPVTFSQERGIYRTFRWGKNLQLFFLDQRSFRSAKASANGTCDNPDTGSAGPGADGAAERPQRLLGSRALPRAARSPRPARTGSTARTGPASASRS